MSFDAGTIETTLTIDRSPFRTGLIEARKEAEAFEKRGIKLKVDVDKSFTGQIQRAINETQSKAGRGIRIPIEIDKKTVDDFQEQLDRIGDNTETTAQRSGNRFARALLNPLVVQLGLVPGIAMAAAAGGALALGLLPLAFGAIGVAALKSNEQIKSTYAELWYDIKTEAAEIAEPLIGTFENVANRMFGTWRQLRPELAAIFRDSGPLIETFVDGVLGAAEQAVPRFRTAIALSGPAMRGFASLIEDVGAGVGEMTVEMAESSVDIGRSTQLAGQFLRGLLQDVGSLVAMFSGFWADIGPRFNQTFDMLMDAVLGFTEGGLRGLGDGMTVTLAVFNALLEVIGPVAGILGQTGGTILGLVGSWKLLSGVIGLVAKAWSFLKPAEWMRRMSGFTSAVGTASAAMGGWITRATGSEAAGKRMEGAVSKVGSAISKSAAALPILGTGIILLQSAIEHFWPSAETLADKIQQGGAAAEEARGQMYSIADGYNRGNLWAQTFAETSEEVRAAIDKQRASMTAVERAQQDAAKAQRDYDYAVERFGVNSSQAVQASVNLAGATDDVAYEQEKAAAATQTHTDKIIEQTNLMLGAVGARLNYQAALLQLEQAQRAATDAVKEHGVGSLEAREADISYQQQLLSVVNSIGQRVTAENKALGETRAGELATAAMRMEIARLAVEAGTNLPPALAEMAAGLSDAELKAMGVTREVDATGNSIYRLPPGKTLSFPNNAGAATGGINQLTNAILAIPPSKWFTFYYKYVMSGNPPPDSSGAAGSGGLLGSSSGPGRADGGPVKRNNAYWVGERGMPELFFPDIDGFVMNGRDSARVASRNPDIRRGSPADFFGDDGAAAPTMSSEQLAGAVATAIAQVFGGRIRLEIDGSGLARVVTEANLRNGAR